MTPLDRVPYLSNYDISDEERRALEREVVVLTDEKAETLSGALQLESAETPEDIHGVIDRLDAYEFFPDIQDRIALVGHLMDTNRIILPIADVFMKYLNYEAIMRDYETKYPGLFTPGGYISKRNDSRPEPQPSVVDLELVSTRIAAYGASYKLSLPTDPGNLDESMGVMGVDSFEECKLTKVDPHCAMLKGISVSNAEIEPLNEFVGLLCSINKNKQKFDTLQAAIEAEGPESVAQLLDIAQNLDSYSLYSRCFHPADYGSHILYDTDEYNDLDEFAETVRDFIDFEKYGRYKMEEDNVKATNFGFLRSDREPFANAELGMRLGQ